MLLAAVHPSIWVNQAQPVFLAGKDFFGTGAVARH
jgi:hypothetical protein